MVWTLCTRHAFDRKIGRIISMEAPVVPMTDARSVPISRMTVLTAGVPFKDPFT